MRTTTRILVLATIYVAFGSYASAHGPQIQVTGETGQVITRSIFFDAPYGDRLTDRKTVYVIPLKEFNGVWYSRPNDTPDPLDPDMPLYYSGPGAAYGYGYMAGEPQVFEVGSQFALGFTSGFQSWNGALFGDAGDTELEAFRGSTTARTSDMGPFASLVFPEEGLTEGYGGAGAEAHNTIRYRVLGDGMDPTSPVADGIYLVGLQLSTTSPGIEPSDPFLFVLHKNTPRPEVQLAVDALGVDPSLVQFVPEPAFGPTGLVLTILYAQWLHRRPQRCRR